MRRRTVLIGIAIGLGGCAEVVEEDSDQPEEPADDAGGEADTDPSALEPDAIEERFLERFNAMRHEHSRREVYRNRFLSEMGQEHAADMAEHDYIGHVDSNNVGIEERFDRRGLLPDCELEIPGSDAYYPGAENVAGAAVGRVTHPGTEETFDVRTNDDVAAFLMDSWMTSEPHREVMVLESVEAIGLGVAIRDDGEIFAALEFC